MTNTFGLMSLQYIWSHPNSRGQQIQAIFKFFSWQVYKRLSRNFIDIKLVEKSNYNTNSKFSQVKLRCHPDSRSAASVIYCGLYDYNEMNFLLKYLRQSDSFLDIGSNIGVYTLLASSVIEFGTIYSIEALPKNYIHLQENISLNHLTQVECFEIAVSSHEGSVQFEVSENDSMSFISSVASEKTISVKVDTLDHLMQHKTVDFLTLAKMDIEGAELLALQGATTLLKRQIPYVWILEINDSVNHFGYQKQDVVQFLADHGYGLYQYDADTNELKSATLSQQEGNNVLAIAESRLNFVRQRLLQTD